MESLFSILLFVGFLYLMMRFGCGAHMRGSGCGHSSHRHNQGDQTTSGHTAAKAKEMTRDPVCGMEIEAAAAAHSAQDGPDTFYFCSKACYQKFQERPEEFMNTDRMEKRNVA